MLRDEVLGAQEYPLVYRVVPAARVVIASVAVAYFAGMVYQVVGMMGPRPRVSFDWFLACACVVLGAIIGYLMIWAFTARVTIYADRFVQSKPFIKRNLSLGEIAGRRYTKGPGAGYPVIVPKHGLQFSLDDFSYGLDARFTRWYQQLQKLD